MILAFDTSSAACTAALFDGAAPASRAATSVIGRGHSERLVPMIAEMLDGRAATRILVGVGPGSFTGIRVGDRRRARPGDRLGRRACRHVLAGAAGRRRGGDGEVAAAVAGGHGELFVQQFDGMTVERHIRASQSSARRGGEVTTAPLVVGSGAEALVEARGWGEAREAWPSAADALRLPEALRTLPPKPVYARAPDARVREAA